MYNKRFNMSYSLAMISGLLVKSIDSNYLVIEGGDTWQMTFQKNQGQLVSYKYNNYEYLEEPITPNFWRAPTDNDKGGGGGINEFY